MSDDKKSDDNPFKKSAKVQRSPIRGNPHSETSRPESESDEMDQVRQDLLTRKRKEVSSAMPGSSRSKRTSMHGTGMAEMQVDPADVEHPEATVSAPEDEFTQVSELLCSVNRWFSAQYKNKKLTIHHMQGTPSLRLGRHRGCFRGNLGSSSMYWCCLLYTSRCV